MTRDVAGHECGCRGYWHQDVAVKLLRMDHVDADRGDARRQQEAFKEEVASFKNTRHENIVLFLGYCMVPPKLGIVMNYCRGRSLHAAIHAYPARFDLAKIVAISLQITQGTLVIITRLCKPSL